MTQRKSTWLFLNAALLLYYGFVLVLLLQGAAPTHLAVLAAVLILAAHVLEIPLARKLLADLDPATPRLVLMTVLFGFTWWLPARRGIYAAR